MANYAEKNLTKGEQIVLDAKKSFGAVFPHFIRFLTTELTLTNKKVIGKVGFIRTHSLSAALNRIQNVSVSSGLMGKIFKYGTVKIETAGSEPLYFYGIKRPEEFKKAVFNQIDVFEQDRLQNQASQMAGAMANAIKQ